MSQALVLFGATGDLAKEKLFPALASMARRGVLHGDLKVIAIGRRPYDDAAFRAHLGDRYTGEDEAFFERVSYFEMDMLDPAAHTALAAALAHVRTRTFYLAIAPSTVTEVLKGLSVSGAYRHGDGFTSRVVMEKPFGTDEPSARALNAVASELFVEESIYRIDHYLGKDTVENVLAFRFSNPIFESVWNADHIDHIQITSAETAGVEGRLAFYAETGAMRDLVQNHLLQLLTLLTIDEPTELTFDGLADAKMEILRRMRFDAKRTVLAAYDKEDVIERLNGAETYAMTTAEIESPRWRGMPIYIRTGKRLHERVTEVSVHFKPSDQRLFTANPEHMGNVVTFRIQPNEGVFLKFAVKRPGARDLVDGAQMVFCYGPGAKAYIADAYENLFQAVFAGQQAIALRSDVIEESWRIVDEVRAATKGRDCVTYAPGSWGPAEAEELMHAEGRRWQVEEQNVCNGVVIQ